MRFKAEILGLDKPNKNGRVYSQEAIEQWIKSPIMQELTQNHAIPVWPEPFDPYKEQTPIGVAYIDTLIDNGLNIAGEISDTVLKDLENLYIVPCGYSDNIHTEVVDGQEIDVIDKYEPTGFFLSDNIAFYGPNNNCRLIPCEEML